MMNLAAGAVVTVQDQGMFFLLDVGFRVEGCVKLVTHCVSRGIRGVV
jgi:hypothetical protein